jgi:hypothetical protein
MLSALLVGGLAGLTVAAYASGARGAAAVLALLDGAVLAVAGAGTGAGLVAVSAGAAALDHHRDRWITGQGPALG